MSRDNDLRNRIQDVIDMKDLDTETGHIARDELYEEIFRYISELSTDDFAKEWADLGLKLAAMPEEWWYA